jgi:aldose 1-epimerase
MFQISTTDKTAGAFTGPVVELKHDAGLASAEIWTANGFNCLSWKIAGGGSLHDVLYSAPDWLTNPVPTRSGVPILFPFPNRIRDGKFFFQGIEYSLPTNDSTKKNAIHGYAPRYPWRIVDQGASNHGAFVTGQFRPALDAPEVEKFWPTDYVLNITYRLSLNSLRIEAKVFNPGTIPLPFGLGFHPYFRFPIAPADSDISRYRFQMPAHSIWPLEESLPTGQKAPVPAEIDWNRSRLLADVALDTLYTDLETYDEPVNGLLPRAQLRHADLPGALQVWASKEYREMVLFTPAHRKAFCIEPYTCPTDAIHLAEKGIDSGWQQIDPGQEWSAVVEIRWDEKATGVARV